MDGDFMNVGPQLCRSSNYNKSRNYPWYDYDSDTSSTSDLDNDANAPWCNSVAVDPNDEISSEDRVRTYFEYQSNFDRDTDEGYDGFKDKTRREDFYYVSAFEKLTMNSKSSNADSGFHSLEATASKDSLISMPNPISTVSEPFDDYSQCKKIELEDKLNTEKRLLWFDENLETLNAIFDNRGSPEQKIRDSLLKNEFLTLIVPLQYANWVDFVETYEELEAEKEILSKISIILADKSNHLNHYLNYSEIFVKKNADEELKYTGRYYDGMSDEH